MSDKKVIIISLLWKHPSKCISNALKAVQVSTQASDLFSYN